MRVLPLTASVVASVGVVVASVGVVGGISAHPRCRLAPARGTGWR